MSFFSKIFPFFKARYAPRGARQTFSASAEDLMMNDFLQSQGVKKVFYIDIGAHHPVFGNNTYLFYRNGGAGILIEPNRKICEEIRSKRPRDLCIQAGVGREKAQLDFFLFDQTTRSTFSKSDAEAFEKASNKKPHIEKVQILSLDDVIANYCDGQVVDVISIDAEGLDVEILSGFSFSSRPKIFCVEYVSSGTGVGQESGVEIQKILERNNYHIFARTKSNAIFVQNELL